MIIRFGKQDLTYGIEAAWISHGLGLIWVLADVIAKVHVYGTTIYRQPANCYTFHKAFKLQADDPFNQSIIGKLQSSSRFTTLKEISDNRGHDSYIHIIRSPRIRNIFLRLRIDMNIFSTSRSRKNILSTCPLCSREPETVKHFILKFCRFADERDKFIDSITSYTPSFRMKDDVYQLKCILGLHCPPEAISYCYKYISTIYSLRENDEI